MGAMRQARKVDGNIVPNHFDAENICGDIIHGKAISVLVAGPLQRSHAHPTTAVEVFYR